MKPTSSCECTLHDLTLRVSLEAAQRRCAPFIEQAREHMGRVGDLKGLGIPRAEARVTIHVASAEEVHLVIRLPVPAGQRSTIEQEILQEVLSEIGYAKAKQPPPRPPGSSKTGKDKKY